MRGHVRKRGEKAWSIVYDEGIDPETGKRKQRWVSGYETKRDAEDALGDALKAMRENDYVEPAKKTFRQFCEETWLPHVRETRRPSTVALYERSLRLHVWPRLGSVQLQKLTATQIDGMLRRARKGDDDKKGLSPASEAVLLAITSSALDYARKKKLIRVNPAIDADRLKVKDRKRTIWTTRETGLFLQHIQGDSLEALWNLYALTGIRRGEGVGLRWQDVDLEQMTITVAQQIVPVDGMLIVSDPKTDAGERTLHIDEDTVELLRRHRHGQIVMRELYGTDYRDSDLVFARPDGSPLDPRSISQRFQTLRKAAGLPAVRLHDLRHGVGTTQAVDLGAPIEIVRAQLGHASSRTTADLYVKHDRDDVQRAAANSLAAKLRGER